MILVRRSEERGFADHGWLKARHTFSFGEYYDPAFMGFSVLRVINEDRVAGGSGFPTHPHRDMEIITVVISGALRHRDSMGNEAVILPGEVQRMSAGTGIRHSEFNDLVDQETHLLQIWLLPEVQGVVPGYEQKSFIDRLANEPLVLAASREGRDRSVKLHQDVDLWLGDFKRGLVERFQLRPGRRAWLQVIQGDLFVNSVGLSSGDGAGLETESLLHLEAPTGARFLLFDLP